MSSNGNELTIKTEIIDKNLINDFDSTDEFHMKPNDIIFSSLNMTPKMHDIMAMLFTRMRAEHWFIDGDMNGKHAVPTYTFKAKDIAKFMCLKSPSKVSSILARPAANLSHAVIGIYLGDEFDFRPLFSRISYKKGVLTAVPNNELRDSYIAKVQNRGYAVIDNAHYISLSDSHSKKTLDILSRFKTGNRLYPVSVKKLQYMYGVFGQDGRVLLKSYQSPITFLNRVVEPSLKNIANSVHTKGKLDIFESSDGHFGYELIDSDGDIKIRFLYKWLGSYSDEDIEEANETITKILQKISSDKKNGQELDVRDLQELISACEVVESAFEDEDEDEFMSSIKGIKEKANQKIKKIKEETKTKSIDDKVYERKRKMEYVRKMLDMGFGDF